MNNLYELRQWHIIEHDDQMYKVLLNKAEKFELDLYFGIFKPKQSLFELVDFIEADRKTFFTLIEGA